MAKRAKFPEGSACKPCWELKYCPYGALVEYFPTVMDSVDMQVVRDRYKAILERFTSGALQSEQDVWGAISELMYNQPDDWEYLSELDADDINCRIFGHGCPVFFLQSAASETKEPRREGRYIPRQVMLKVVRRDNHVCQECHMYVPDDHVEFDHIIPISKGGPTSVDNLRLLCRSCNRKKSNSLDALLK